MAIEWKYRGRIFNLADIETIRRLIAANPEASRWALSRKLCEAWNWKQANGALRDMVCRGLLLMLERAGEIELPPVRRHPPGKQARPEPVIPDDQPVCGRLSELGPLTIEQVRRTPQEALFNGLIEQYHYLGYEQPVGEHLKYLVSAKGQAIACLAWSSSPRHLGCRDRFIGWGMEARRRNIHLLAYNTRFLILPWVTVPHLASHILGRMARQIPCDWRRVEVNVGELDQLLEGARQAPLTDPDYEKLKSALHALVDALAKPRSTEKSSAVLGRKEEPGAQPETESSTQ